MPISTRIIVQLWLADKISSALAVASQLGNEIYGRTLEVSSTAGTEPNTTTSHIRLNTGVIPHKTYMGTYPSLLTSSGS